MEAWGGKSGALWWYGNTDVPGVADVMSSPNVIVVSGGVPRRSFCTPAIYRRQAHLVAACQDAVWVSYHHGRRAQVTSLSSRLLLSSSFRVCNATLALTYTMFSRSNHRIKSRDSFQDGDSRSVHYVRRHRRSECSLGIVRTELWPRWKCFAQQQSGKMNYET